MSIFKKVFGSRNKRELKRLGPVIDKIASLEETMEAKSDGELQGMTAEFRQRLDKGAELDDLLPETFATVREASKRILGMRHYDVQMIGGIILHKGRIAEMRTGEGKTLVATLPVYLNALHRYGVHVVTVNDYLARRDAEWMGQLYGWLGLEVGVIVHGIEDFERQQAYRADITYGQNNEFGFDYLRDNMKMSPDRMVQHELNYAVIDEVDSILIDEARTPLIISGPAEQSEQLYKEVDRIVLRLQQDVDYTVDEKSYSTILTDLGVEKAQSLLSIDNLYDPSNLAYVHHVNNALRAHTLYRRDKNYLIQDGEVIIIDEHTGRAMPGRRWSDGLHQAIEAKEDVTIQEENQTLATVTFQNFFRMYNKLSGMTGTADTEAAEFHHIYKLEVTVIPTNQPIQRNDSPDLVYKNEKGKFKAVTEDILESHSKGQPVLVGTTSVEKSEVIAHVLRQHKVEFEVLNAKQHEREAAVVAQAGRKGAITISTNMAGRGTDIILGGNPEFLAKVDVQGRDEHEANGQALAVEKDEMYQATLAQYRAQCAAEREEVLAAGGLKIIGTERHESRRIDNQLRGRAGRQGDPGASRFYLSLEDDLMRIFGADRITGLMERLGMEEEVPIEHSWVTKSVENAQKKVEGSHFDSRKNVLEYDDVMNQQRKTIYSLRKQILRGEYRPTLSAEQEKAGELAQAPTTSGDWTVENLSKELRGNLEKLVRAAILADEERKAVDGADSEHTEMWRMFRHEVWRQTGALIDEIETEWNKSGEALTNLVVTGVAQSMIQQRERLYDLCDQVIRRLLDTYCPPSAQEDDWDLQALEDALCDHFNLSLEVPKKGLDSSQELAEKIWLDVENQLAEREKELTRPWMLYFSRHFGLEEIDQQWIEHLKTMAHLREGIGLRGYGQKDPKKEYKKEGFDLFTEMMENIQANVCKKIFRVQIQRQEQEIPDLEQEQREMTAHHEGAKTSGSDSSIYDDAVNGEQDASHGSSAQKKRSQTVRRQAPKVGRNSPCPCGSGKKYKKCHGRAEEVQARA